MSVHWEGYVNSRHGYKQKKTYSIKRVTCKYCLRQLQEGTESGEKS